MATEPAALSDDHPAPLQVGSLLPSPLCLGLRDLTDLKGRRVQEGRHLVVGGYGLQEDCSQLRAFCLSLPLHAYVLTGAGLHGRLIVASASGGSHP